MVSRSPVCCLVSGLGCQSRYQPRSSLGLCNFAFVVRPSSKLDEKHSSICTDMSLKLASFNIRYGWPQSPGKESKTFDQERPWYERREGLVDQVMWEEPDIIGFQEVGAHFCPNVTSVGSNFLPYRSSIISLMTSLTCLGLHIAMSASDEMMVRLLAKLYLYFGERR